MTLTRNTIWLSVSQAVGLLSPLIMVPFLARALRPEGWAPVLAAQALAAWLTLILEYASDISGTREIARARQSADSDTRRATVVRGVQSAKLLLAPVAAAIVALVAFNVPVLRGQGLLLAWTLAYAVFRGLNPFWYFQGVERVRVAAAVEAVTRLVGAVSVVLVVRGAADGWLVLALQATLAAVSCAVLTVAMSRDVKLLAPSVAAGVATLREYRTIFGIRAANGVYGQASTLLFGLTGSPAAVAAYGGAERIVRAGTSMLQPVTQAFLPRVSSIQVADPNAAMQFIKRSLVGLGLLGVVAGGVVFFAAPPVVGLLLGAGYEPAITSMRALALLPAIVAVNTVLGLYWAIPFGFERAVLGTIIASALANLALIWLLVPRYGALGMCAAVVGAELVVMGILGVLFVTREAHSVRRTA